MKKSVIRIFVPAVALLLVAGCSEVHEKDIPVAATVTVEKTCSDAVDGFNMRFTPSEDAVSFEYALTQAGTLDEFNAGTLAETVTVDGNQPTDVEFSGLDSRTVYTVFARAYGENGEPGGTAQYRVMTGDAFYKLELQYASDQAAGISIVFTNDYYDSEYYFGTPADKEAFLAGTLETSSVGDLSEMRIAKNYFDLSPSTEYVMYVKGYNRIGLTEYRELHFTTAATDQCPKASFTVLDTDIYTSRCRIEANELTGKIVAIVADEGNLDAAFDINWSGDMVQMLDTWGSIGWSGAQSSTTGSLDMEYVTASLSLDKVMDVYVLVYDKDMVPAGIQKFNMSTPSFDPDAKGGSVSIEISDITAKGATYKYTAEENNFAYMFDTVDADWYDNFKETSSDWHEFYLSDYLFRQGYYFFYSKGSETPYNIYTEASGTPLTRYYAAACPMNGNGPREGGWLPVVLEEYTTVAE